MNPQFFQTFTAFIDNTGQIICQSWQGNQTVGVSVEKYKEAEKMASDAMTKAAEYKQKLIDNGLLQPELSQEEQIAELRKTVGNLSSQLADASGDIERLLNVFSDITFPDAQDIAAIEALSKAAYYLHHAMGSEEEHEWERHYPDVAKHKHALDAAFHVFMSEKAAGHDAAAKLPAVFAAHKSLAQAVKAMCTTPAEAQAVQSAVKA